MEIWHWTVFVVIAIACRHFRAAAAAVFKRPAPRDLSEA
jgi:hypothetical protein